MITVIVAFMSIIVGIAVVSQCWALTLNGGNAAKPPFLGCMEMLMSFDLNLSWREESPGSGNIPDLGQIMLKSSDPHFQDHKNNWPI